MLLFKRLFQHLVLKIMNMKKSPIILICLFCGLLTTMCNKDLLNTEPGDRYTESNFWESQAAASAALTGCYTILSNASLYGGDATALFEETASPNAYDYDNTVSFNSVAKGEMSASTGGVVSGRWSDCYKGIGRCNTFLVKVEEVPMDNAVKIQMKGEAHFLRALYYFVLQNYYGAVPLVLDAPDPATQAKLPRTDRVKVIAQVLADLDSAAGVLPLKYAATDLGRATKGAALALKARVLLFEASPLNNTGNDLSKWQAAADAAKSVMDLAPQAGYGLFASYRSLFLPANENNKEVLFDVQFIPTDEGNSFDLIDRQYNTNAPLLNLAQAYDMNNGLPITNPASGYDPNNPYAKRDPRLYATIVYPGDTFMAVKVTPSRFAITGYGLKKYSIYDKGAPATGQADLKAGQSGTNYIILRYADILLDFAEAKNEATGPDATVYSAVNLVRERAGMPDLQPVYSQSALRDLIRHERRIEFAGEGKYYNDIRRWRTAETVLNDTIFTYSHSPIEVRKFDPNRNYWWPIPQAQLDLNPKLTQNKGY
jgi:starch-binding outer membrane protein, SusD/RagB family